MPRWPSPDDPFAGRKRRVARWPKVGIGSQATPGHFESGGRVSSTKHPEGLGTVKSGYLTGKAGGKLTNFTIKPDVASAFPPTTARRPSPKSRYREKIKAEVFAP